MHAFPTLDEPNRTAPFLYRLFGDVLGAENPELRTGRLGRGTIPTVAQRERVEAKLRELKLLTDGETMPTERCLGDIIDALVT